MYHMSCAALSRLGKVAVEQRLHVQAAGPYPHREHARLFVDHDEPLILVDDVVVLARLGRCARLPRDLDHTVGHHLKVEMRLGLAIDSDTAMTKD